MLREAIATAAGRWLRWRGGPLLGQLVGYLPPGPSGEGETLLRSMQHPWLLPIVVGLGGLLSGLIVFNLSS